MALSTKRLSAQKDWLLKELQETAVPLRRLNADIEATLYRRMKVRAVQEDRTLSEQPAATASSGELNHRPRWNV